MNNVQIAIYYVEGALPMLAEGGRILIPMYAGNTKSERIQIKKAILKMKTVKSVEINKDFAVIAA